jgi:pSer/pThr/pTyr-binding forkhead associated (FHA) protein
VVAAYLEVFTPAGLDRVPLEELPIWIGRADANDIVVAFDKTAGRQHAVVEPVAGGWCVRDLGSRNGTFVAGTRILAMQVLHHGDEVMIGATKLVFRDSQLNQDLDPTEAGERPPDLTRRERDVLRALCRPLAGGRMFTEPATLREIATALVVTTDAVEQHLLRLYDKFNIVAGSGTRRSMLANEALRRNAVTIAELAEPPA